VRLLDLPDLPVPGRVDVGGGVQDVRRQDGVALDSSTRISRNSWPSLPLRVGR
jgi:hypothetical protein